MNINPNTSILPSHNSKFAHRHHSDTQSLLIQPLDQLDIPTQQQQKSIARIYSEQAWMFFQEENWHKAIVACKNALEIAPDTVDAYKILGNILQRQGKKPEALGVYAKALQINPNSATIYANLGSFYAEQKKWQQALDYFQQAVILDPSFAGAYRSLAQIWEELGDMNQALECFCQAVNLEPEILTASEYFNFGAELYQQGKAKEASIFYIQGVKLDPQAEKELARLVDILEEIEEWQQAVNYYHQLMSIAEPTSDLPDFKHKPIKRLLSLSKSKLGQANHQSRSKPFTSKAQSLSAQLLPSSPTTQLSNNNQVANIASVTQNAATEQKEPNSAISWNNLGSLYAQEQQWAKAISCYQEAIELDPQFTKSHRNLARVYHKIGDRQKASLCWYEAFTSDPSQVNSEEYFSLAKNLLEQGQVDKSIACLRRTIELKPNFDKAHLILSKLLESRGKKQ